MTQKQMARMGGKARAKKLSKAHKKRIARAGGMARARHMRAVEAAQLALKRNAEAMKTGAPLVRVPKYSTPGAFGGTSNFNKAAKSR